MESENVLLPIGVECLAKQPSPRYPQRSLEGRQDTGSRIAFVTVCQRSSKKKLKADSNERKKESERGRARRRRGFSLSRKDGCAIMAAF